MWGVCAGVLRGVYIGSAGVGLGRVGRILRIVNRVDTRWACLACLTPLVFSLLSPKMISLRESQLSESKVHVH